MSRQRRQNHLHLPRVTLIGVSLCVGLSGCANIKPYQREYVADPIMQMTIDAEEDSYDLHMHRALTQGLYGTAGGGGGCGCEQ